ncbi:protein DEHYDRATION-INDUCED 19 homolog 5-like [Lotus japonicus]|uniref:protein DEHYDRATION-INDUCED 19 homolog 5-like n=1 Tax=Lotus japonicus TaxID=34305 RepID=UPI0025840020|nr:protein DEHYDRATION-INDUCED 19 homolog 5-like [Lotus japonicus]
MDFDYRARIHSAKHLSAAQAARFHSDNYSGIHYIDVDNDGRSDFRCPFCDFEIEVPELCSNLEEEHCFALKNMVCPVCEENLGKDANNAITQFTHSSSRRWAWKTEKSSNWSGNSEMLRKKLAARGNKQESMADPLLSPFICNVPIPNPNNIHPGENSTPRNKDIDIHNSKRSGTDAPDVGVEQDQQERKLRAAFAQQLVLSTIFE